MTETSTATPASEPSRQRSDEEKGAGKERRGNPFARLALFLRQIVAELRKVVWPTRSDLITYTSVVMVFVLVMIGIVFSLDYVFAKGSIWLFT